MMNEINDKYNWCIINTTLVQAVLDRHNSEAANSHKHSTEKFLSQCTSLPDHAGSIPAVRFSGFVIESVMMKGWSSFQPPTF